MRGLLLDGRMNGTLMTKSKMNDDFINFISINGYIFTFTSPSHPLDPNIDFETKFHLNQIKEKILGEKEH